MFSYSTFNYILFSDAATKFHARTQARKDNGQEPAPKFIIPLHSNPSINQRFYTNIRRANDTEAIFRTNFFPLIKSSFFADARIDKIPLVCPKPNFKIPHLPATTAVTSSFRGSICSSCFEKGRSHTINNTPRIFLLGDEFFPVLVGSAGDCLPTMRIESGDFYQARILLEFHIKNGLKICQGSLIVICLTSHLLRVGHAEYWTQLLTFIQWARDSCLEADILPTVVPFPVGFKTHQLVSICQLYHHLLSANVGEVPGSRGPSCLLWKPFRDSVLGFGAGMTFLPAPPISVPEIGGFTECDTEFVQGMRGNWLTGMPDEIQYSFFINLTTLLREDNPSSNLTNLVVPSEESIRGAILKDCHQNKKIFLLGTSILGRTVEPLSVLAHGKGVDVINQTQGGDFFTKKQSYSFLRNGNPGDLCFISICGNSSLNKLDKQPQNKVWHLLKPSMLSDVDANLLSVNMSQVVKRVKDSFTGHIFVLGPIPRHTDPCCEDIDHHILDHAGNIVPMVEYMDALSQFLGSAEYLRQDRVSYIDYSEIFGDGVQLDDGVHLSKESNNILSTYIFNLLDPSLRSTIKTGSSDLGQEFSQILTSKGIPHSDSVDDKFIDAI